MKCKNAKNAMKRSIFVGSSDKSDSLKIKKAKEKDRIVKHLLGDDDSDLGDDDSHTKRYVPAKAAARSRQRVCLAACGLMFVLFSVFVILKVIRTHVYQRITSHHIDIPGIFFLSQYLKKPLTTLPLVCHARPHTDSSGDLVGSTNGPANKQASADACCDMCNKLPECQVFVYDEKTQDCWLKKQDNPFPERPFIYTRSDLQFTSGAMYSEPVKVVSPETTQNNTCIDVLVSSNGGAENAYVNWQTKILYKNYLQTVEPLYKHSDEYVPAVFTRILHRTKDDGLSASIPTLRVEPRRAQCDVGCDFPVGDRADAFMKVVDSKTLQCDYVFMIETDYLFIDWLKFQDLPNDNSFHGFHYGYIVPNHANSIALTKKFLPRHSPDEVPQTGPAPGLMTKSTFEKVVRTWHILQQRIDDDEDAVKSFGWVRDMYSWSYALAMTKTLSHAPLVPFNRMMVQIPADDTLGNAMIIHFTWGPVISVNGTVVWRFDKRAVDGNKLRPIADLPKWNENMRLQANETVTVGVHALLSLFQKVFNRALLQ